MQLGALYRKGLPISSSIAESAVNQLVSHRMAKKQQMRWTDEGAHCLAQVRVADQRRTLGAANCSIGKDAVREFAARAKLHDSASHGWVHSLGVDDALAHAGKNSVEPAEDLIHMTPQLGQYRSKIKTPRSWSH